MTGTLGIHISEDGIAAVIATDDAAAEPIVIRLGSNGPLAATAIAAAADGAVLVGDAAVGAAGPVVVDPVDRARRGRTGALTAVIAHVAGRSVTASPTGLAPSRLGLVVPDDFDADARDQVVTAANAAGFTDVAVVPETAALARTALVDDSVRWAAGAALLASVDALSPLVTREDLGQLIKPRPVTNEPVPPANSGPVSVFDKSAKPARPTVGEIPAPGAARREPARQVARPAPMAMVRPPPLTPVTNSEVPLGAIIAVVVALLVAVPLVVFGLLRSAGDEAASVRTDDAPTSPIVSSTMAAPTSTTLPTTTVVVVSEGITTTSSSTSTTAAPTSTTVTTTTRPVRVALPGPVILVESGLNFDTGVVVQFGQEAEIVLNETEAVLGVPNSDSGAVENDFCTGALVRFVRWGNLELVFTNMVDSGVLRFTQWYADGHLSPTGLVTLDGLGESATVGFLEVTYPTALVLVPAFEGGVVGIFAVTNPQTGAVLNGTTLGIGPGGVVTSLWAGDSCTRAFT